MQRAHLGLMSMAVLLTGCGSAISDKLLGKSNSSDVAAKVACPGTETGFFVCMSSDSSISDQALLKAIEQGLTDLATLVNTSAFESQISSAFQGGSGISAALTATNYIVKITGYCDSASHVLANAEVGGSSINYNECQVQRDASGQPNVAAVAGILLHEISHNIGYTHPDVNPSRSTVPYYLGDLAQSSLDASLVPSSGPSTTAAHSWQHDFHD